jgi:hypothetical protein
MRSSDVNYAIIIAIPIDCWLASHFAKNDVDVFYALTPSTFEYAIRYAPPSVSGRKLHFDAKFSKDYVWKHIGMRMKIHGKVKSGNQVFEHFANSRFELNRFGKFCARLKFRCNLCAELAENFFEGALG